MKVFLGWSKPTSGEVAKTLRTWLPKVIQALKPFMSEEDVGKGSQWLTTIAEQLKTCGAAVLTLTRENQADPWINFEAGVLTGAANAACVCPLLFDFAPAELTWPLAQFQGTGVMSGRSEVFRMVKTLNTALLKHGGSALADDQID